ncbi:MAG: hypothetical protein ACLFPX_05185 [Candidatus Omnitrophota bacterium]
MRLAQFTYSRWLVAGVFFIFGCSALSYLLASYTGKATAQQSSMCVPKPMQCTNVTFDKNNKHLATKFNCGTTATHIVEGIGEYPGKGYKLVGGSCSIWGGGAERGISLSRPMWKKNVDGTLVPDGWACRTHDENGGCNRMIVTYCRISP